MIAVKIIQRGRGRGGGGEGRGGRGEVSAVKVMVGGGGGGECAGKKWAPPGAAENEIQPF